MYTQGYTTQPQKEQNAIAAAWMDPEITILSEVSQEDKYHVSLIRGIKTWHKWTYLRSRNRLTERTHPRLPRGRGVRESGVRRGKRLRIEWIIRVLLYRVGNYIHYPGTNHNGKRIYMCVWLHHLAVQQKLTPHCKSITLRAYKFKQELPLQHSVSLQNCWLQLWASRKSGYSKKKKKKK